MKQSLVYKYLPKDLSFSGACKAHVEHTYILISWSDDMPNSYM